MRANTTPDRSTISNQVAAEVRAELARKRIPVSKLPKLLGGSQSYWSRRINADVALNVEDLAALAGLLEVPASTFWCAVRELNPQPAVKATTSPRGANTIGVAA